MSSHSSDRWSSRTGLILAVASGAIGLGNFLRFPGQAVQYGGGAFMVPYIISFLILGIPVVFAEWIVGRMGGERGFHSYPLLFQNILTGVPLRLLGALGVVVPILIYVYYVFVESWCLAYAFKFLNALLFPATTPAFETSSGQVSKSVVAYFTEYFLNFTGAKQNGSSFETGILTFTLICVGMNFILVYRGLSKGLEFFSKLAIPLMIGFSTIILVRVLTLDHISLGLGKMWNPDWEKLLHPEVWIAAAGQIFFSLSTGFGIALVFSSYLSRKDDLALSSLSSASINEFCEVIFGGLITIPIAFLFLGDEIGSFGTFGMGFISLPSVFTIMPFGNFFGFFWYLVLFLAALTSSITMLQPGLIFLQEGLGLSKKTGILLLLVFTISLTLPIIYFNKEFNALDFTDFFIGTILIYVLAMAQIWVFKKKIGVDSALEYGYIGSHIRFPKILNFTLKYITPYFLLLVFILFCVFNAPEYWKKLNLENSIQKALAEGGTLEDGFTNAWVCRSVLLVFGFIFTGAYFLVDHALKRSKAQ